MPSRQACATVAIALLVLVVGAASGCLSSGEEDTSTPETGDGEANGTNPSDEAPNGEDEAGGESGSSVPAPAPPTGRRWSYEASGAWNDLGSFDVVLAQTGDEGLLLAGAGPEDLGEEIVFDRPWHGPVDGELNPAEGTTFWEPLFDFPLHDGKTWSWDAGETVRAEATTLETPAGSADGFAMVLEGREGVQMRWTYAPSVAFLTSLTYAFANTTVLDVELVDVGSADEAVWFQPGPEASTNGNPEPDDPTLARLEVPEGYDAVLAAAGARGGGQASLQPPPDSGTGAWTYEGTEAEQWTYELFPAHEGTWTLQANEDPASTGEDGYVGLTAHAVAWVPPEDAVGGDG